MTNEEFSNTFDILYNNIMSNQAPGLDEFEKSVFLTKAQDEIVKAYFNPRLNKTQEGFDGNEKRQIDFSMIMRSAKYESLSFEINGTSTGTVEPIRDAATLASIVESQGSLTSEQYAAIDSSCLTAYQGPSTTGKPQKWIVNPFLDSFFDDRENTKSVVLDSSILMFVNEYVTVTRKSANAEKSVRLTIIPINYTEYSRLMSKPYKRPLNYQAWRILDNGVSSSSDSVKRAELVVGPNDVIEKYVIRYVKRPRAIRLITFDNVTLEGSNEEQTCELDPILHQEILQRAVELAKASYTGDLNSQVALGQSSQTSIGAVATQASR